MSDTVKAITWDDMEERERDVRLMNLYWVRSSDSMTSARSVAVLPQHVIRVFMELVEHLDVSYLPSAPPNTFQTFDIYVPHLLDTPTTPALVCFIHGGAWRS